MIALLSGSRDWTDPLAIRWWIRRLQSLGFTRIIEGESAGADTLARAEATDAGMHIYRVPIQYEKYGTYTGTLIQAQDMVNMQPDIAVIFSESLEIEVQHLIELSRYRSVPVIYVKKYGDYEIL
jgi:hypothetical protein